MRKSNKSNLSNRSMTFFILFSYFLIMFFIYFLFIYSELNHLALFFNVLSYFVWFFTETAYSTHWIILASSGNLNIHSNHLRKYVAHYILSISGCYYITHLLIIIHYLQLQLSVNPKHVYSTYYIYQQSMWNEYSMHILPTVKNTFIPFIATYFYS